MAGIARSFLYGLGRALRETGAAIDRIGLQAIEKPIFKEPFSRHRTIMNLYHKRPAVETDVFVAPNAAIVGNVSIATKSSVWYGSVIRGDLNDVEIGAYTSIGERAVVSTVASTEGHVAAITKIGNYVQVGPSAQLQSCIIEDNAVIGAGAIVMEGAYIEAHAYVADGAVVHPGRRVPAGQYWAGNPAKYVRDLSKDELAHAEHAAQDTTSIAGEHHSEFLPYTTAYQQAERLGLDSQNMVDSAVAEIKKRQNAASEAAAAVGSSTISIPHA